MIGSSLGKAAAFFVDFLDMGVYIQFGFWISDLGLGISHFLFRNLQSAIRNGRVYSGLSPKSPLASRDIWGEKQCF